MRDIISSDGILQHDCREIDQYSNIKFSSTYSSKFNGETWKNLVTTSNKFKDNIMLQDIY